jgi:hypothetical protein
VVATFSGGHVGGCSQEAYLGASLLAPIHPKHQVARKTCHTPLRPRSG